jgi:3-oxoacyl-ACP reductase-like protein
MPYDIRSNYGGCSGYAVVGPGGDVKGCHATRGEAVAQQRALYANEPEAKVTKYRGDLYEQLTPEEKAFHDALLGVVEQYGPKDFYNTSNPSNGRIMWDAWGGDAGFSWSRAIVERTSTKKEVVWENSPFSFRKSADE